LEKYRTNGVLSEWNPKGINVLFVKVNVGRWEMKGEG